MISIRARERGMSYWPFVVTLLLLFVAAYMAYENNQRATQLNEDLQKAKDRAAAADERYTEVSQKYDQVKNKTGFVEGQDVSVEKINAWMADFINRVAEAATLEVQKSRFVEGSGGEIEEIDDGTILVRYVLKADVNRLAQPSARLDQINEAIISGFERMKADMNLMTQAQATAKAETAAAKAAHLTQLQNKDQAIADAVSRANALQANLDEVTREKDEQIDALRSQIDTVTAQLESVREELETQIAQLSSDLNQSRSTVSQLNTREKPYLVEGPDGSVLHAANANLVIIDLGKKDMLMPGTVFTVLGKIKGGELVERGTIKVTSVGDTTAEARVLEGGGINQGDLVQSAVYSAERTLHFHLLGDFTKMGRSDAERRLQALGAKIDDSVVPTTHYVVVGNPSEGQVLEDTDAWRRAKEYNIPIITEAQLESFTRY